MEDKDSKIITEIGELVNQYNKMTFDSIQDGQELSLLLKGITARLYYLETIRSKYKNDFEVCVFRLVQNDNSVSRSINEAHVKVPELYLLRRIMDAAYRCCDAMRTNLSFLKQELNRNSEQT